MSMRIVWGIATLATPTRHRLATASDAAPHVSHSSSQTLRSAATWLGSGVSAPHWHVDEAFVDGTTAGAGWAASGLSSFDE
jgi:hypothetical protein